MDLFNTIQMLIWFITLTYLGIVSIETVMIVHKIDHTIFEAVVRTSDKIVKYITIKSNKSNKTV